MNNMTKGKKELKPLEPPDLKQCQAEIPNPNYGPFRMGGSDTDKPRLRCREKPTVVVTEKRDGEDGRRGSMSLCNPCLAEAKHMFGLDYFDVKKLF